MVVLYGVTIKAFAGMLFCYCLIVLTYVDAKTQMLPDIITKPLIAFGLLQAYFGLYTDFKSACIGAFAGYWSLWLINTIFRLIRHKEGMGYGDFKLFAAIGAWIGFAQLPFVIFFSSVLGIFVAVFLARLPENKLSSPSPFGPSLAITGLISMIWGQQIINWYLGLYI
jgi:leader peptidase (prepilin peptidase)/N-methyltransferase